MSKPKKTEEERLKYNEYMRKYKREWRKRNKNKVHEYQARYWMKKARELGLMNDESNGN